MEQWVAVLGRSNSLDVAPASILLSEFMENLEVEGPWGSAEEARAAVIELMKSVVTGQVPGYLVNNKWEYVGMVGTDGSVLSIRLCRVVNSEAAKPKVKAKKTKVP